MNNAKKSDPYKTAVSYVKLDKQIQLETGGIEDFGYMVAYDIKATEAYVTFKVIGKRDDVTVYCYLSKVNDKWIVDRIEYQK